MRAMSRTHWLTLVFVVAGAGCGPKAPGTADDTPSDDTPTSDANPADPDGGIPMFPDAGTCGMQTEPIEVVNLGDPPDLLIVLDRSGSMASPIPNFPPDFTSKWDIMKNALNALSDSLEANIRFGLLEFPADDNCGVGAGALRVPVDLNQAAEIHTYFSGRSPNGNTPSHLALQDALAYYSTIPVNPAGRYVLFATDGEPNCSGGDPDTSSAPETVAAVQALAAAGIKTYVIGFGSLFIDDTNLNDCALAGQVPRPGGPPHYYAANNAAELQAALDTISGGIIVPSCSYALASPPPDPDNVTVTANGVPVPRSTAHTNGWDYYPDAMTITFFGSYCDAIQSGATTSVSFTYGCPGPVID
jgi:hypothetical protein